MAAKNRAAALRRKREPKEPHVGIFWVEEFPRGRVMYNTKTRRFTLLADRCILRDKGVVGRVMSELHLPGENTDKGTDAHYRCSSCLRVREGE